MFFLYDANLKLLKTIPSDVYQGSDGADDIYFLVPINPNAAINVAFLLPTGKTLTSRTATKQGEALGLKTPDGAVYSMWSITLTAQETAYAGNVTLQITVVTGTMNMTSQKAVFPVLHGVAPILPDAPLTDVYTDIQATISALQTAVYNTKSVGIKSFVAQEKDAYVAEYEDNATRVVVPDYYLKDDTYYPVTMVYPLSGGTANITEYEFGNNITTIGTSAFYETKVETLEFPNTLANIGDNAFENAGTTTFVFNGAVPKIEADAFKGVTATAYVSAVYYADYVTAFESYPGIAVVKKSETLADVILTADEAKATADKVKTQVNGKLNIDSSETDYPQVYGKDYTGAQTMFDIAEGSAGKTLVRRDKNGKINVADAVDEANAVNKKQLDASVTALEASISTAQSTADEAKNGLANKVDIIEKTNDWKVYARGFWIDGSDLKSLVCTNKPTQYTVVQYGQNGMFTVNDATADQHPVPLKQAKSLISASETSLKATITTEIDNSIVDTYDETSTLAQSGVAVKEAIEQSRQTLELNAPITTSLEYHYTQQLGDIYLHYLSIAVSDSVQINIVYTDTQNEIYETIAGLYNDYSVMLKHLISGTCTNIENNVVNVMQLVKAEQSYTTSGKYLTNTLKLVFASDNITTEE